jgi:hypothetical protein
MSYNPEAQIFQNQVVINDTTNAGITSGGLVVKGGLSTQDTFVTGHVAVNNVRITPNLNDIVNEIQNVLSNSITEFTNITDFYFDNSVTNSFKAQVSITVSTGISKYAIWELVGVYKPSGWAMTSSFTGDITGVNFRIVEDSGKGRIQYTNSNSSGTTTIKFRAMTTQPPGSSPTGSTGIINNTSGPYIADTLIYANTTSSIASSDLTYTSNVFKIGGTARLVGENANSFTNFSNGGAITSMGDMSVATNLIIGSKIGIAKTSPGYSLDVAGDINFTGTFYQNGSVYSGSSVWGTNGTNVFYTAGNLGLGGMTSPSHALEVSGGIKSTSITTGNLISTSGSFANVTATAITAGSFNGTRANFTNAIATAITTGTIDVTTGITAANINFTGDLYKNGAVYVSSQWTTNQDFSIYYTTGNVGIGNTTPGQKLDVTGNIRVSDTGAFTNVTATAMTSGSFNGTSGAFVNVTATAMTSGSFNGTSGAFTNVTATAMTSGSFNGTSGAFTNVTATAMTSGSFNGTSGAFTNVTATAMTSGSFNGTSGAFVNVTATAITSGTFVGTSGAFVNVTATSMTSGSFNGTSGNFTNINGTNSSITSIVATTVSSGSLYLSSNAFISGNLTVSGTTTTINTETTTVEDNLIVLNSGPGGLVDGGILVKRFESGTTGSVNYSGIFYKESTDEYTFATTSSDPGMSPVVINDYIPIRSGYISITNTVEATGLGTGGALNVSGGASILKDVYVGGSLTATGSVTSSSDARLKENIETIENALDKIENFRGVKYTKIATGAQEIGFIAQEIEQSFPEVVSTDSNGFKSVAYGNVTAVLLQCIKELKQEVEDLKLSVKNCAYNA